MNKGTSRIIEVTILLMLITVLPALNQVHHFSIENSDVRKSDAILSPSFSINEQSVNGLNFEYTINGFSISDITGRDNETYKIIRIKGFGISSEVGSPALPVKTEKIIIPPGKIAKVKVTSSGYAEYGNIDIYPAQKPGTDSYRYDSEFKKDEIAYRRDEYFPSDLCKLENVQIYRGTSLGYLKISPVQYNPAARTARIHKNLNISIEFIDLGQEVARERNVRESSNLQILQNVSLNKDILSQILPAEKAGIVLQPAGYLIVTVPVFEEAAEKLAQWKRQLGYFVEIRIQESWSVPEVKSAAEDVYYNSPYDFQYLLIIGDQDHVPDYYYEDYIGESLLRVYSENYFVCMDGIWDYMPEMAHGRISVRNSPEAILVVNKIINYEKTPPADPGFYNKGLHAGYFQDSTRDGVSDYRYAKTTIEMYDYMTARGFESDLVLYTEPDVTPVSFNAYFTGQTAVPPQYLKSNGYPWNGNTFDILNALNDGRLYAFHRDHGHVNEWVQPNFAIDDMNLLHNGNKLPVVLSINCGTGLFAYPEPAVCFAEKLQRHTNGGAVGIVAATAETISGYNDGFIIGMMDAIWSTPGIIPDMGGGTDTAIVRPHQPIYTMGDVMIQGLIRMTQTWDPSGWADRNQFNLYHYFGDPAMKIWTNPPVQITALHADHLTIGSTSLHISASNCPDAIATVCYGNELWKKIKLQNGSGTVYFPAPIDTSIEEITLTLSKHNYIPYIAAIPVLEYPEVDFIADCNEICTSGIVEFTDLTQNDPFSWLWEVSPVSYEFVNSTSADSQHPEIRFLVAGEYSVSLTATNQAGSITLTKDNYIVAHATPDPPLTTNREKCYTDDIPTLLALGTNIRWYADEELTNLLHEGAEYTPIEVSIGDNIYYVNQTLNDCKSEPAMAILTAYPVTPPPSTEGATVCYLDTAVLVASGESIRWYSDSNAETLIAENDTLVLYNLNPGDHIFYANQTINGCPSELSSATATAREMIPAPAVEDAAICHLDTAVLVATGNIIRWYSDSNAENLIAENDTLIIYNLDPGDHYYYANQSINECTSDLSTAIVTSYPVTPTPEVDNATICEFDTAILRAHGTLIRWYTEPELAYFIAEGSSLILYELNPGEHTFYASDTENSCESNFTPAIVNVHARPAVPVVRDVEACWSDTVVLIAEGKNIHWYSDIYSPDPIFKGNEFMIGQPDAGEYNYYVTQSILGCTSERGQVQLIVHNLPVFSLGEDKSLQLGDILHLESPIAGEYLWFNGNTSNAIEFNTKEYGLGSHICWLQVTSVGDCAFTDSVLIHVKKGIDSLVDLTDSPHFVVYPNPTGGIIYIELMQSESIPAMIMLQDTQGRIIVQRNLTDTINEIDLSLLPRGIYFITITSNDISQTSRIILYK